MNIEDIEKIIDRVKGAVAKEIAAAMEERIKWPYYRNQYLTFDSTGTGRIVQWLNDNDDKKHLEIGNVYPENHNHEEHRQALVLQNKLRELADYKTGEEWPKWSRVYYLAYSRDSDIIFINTWDTFTGTFGFKTRDKAQFALYTIGQDGLKLIMKYGLAI